MKQQRVKLGRGRPKKDDSAIVKYRLETKLEKDEEKISTSLQKKGKFIIATNELDDRLLSSVIY